jgi:hypothetical protein
MLRFSRYFTEKKELSIAEQKEKDELALKAYVTSRLAEVGMKPTDSGRPPGYRHIKFPAIMPEFNDKTWKTDLKGQTSGEQMISKWDLDVAFRDPSLFKVSKRYNSIFVLSASKAIDVGTSQKPKTIPKGTEIGWVNSEMSLVPGSGAGSTVLFANKVLTPDKLGTAGREWDIAGLTTATETAVKNAWPGPNSRTLSKPAEMLIDLLHKANTESDTISLSGMDFDAKDYPKISADYGETLSAIWVMRAKNFAKVDFPSAVNNKLIDFYGLRLGAKYPFSVKSGTTGGKVTVMNIIRAIRSRAKTRDYKTDGEIAYQVFKIVEENTMKDQMIKLHQWLLTPNIKKLAKLMGITVDQITVETIDTWTKEQNTVKKDVWIGNKKNKKEKGKFFAKQKEFTQGKNESNSKFKARVKKEERELYEKKGDMSKDNHLLVKKMKTWHAMKGGSQPQATTLRGQDLVRFVITSLGESIHPILNKSEGMAESLTNVARQVAMVQINVNVKEKTLTFKSNFFKTADFKFAWAGYSGGNSLGFTMKMSH